jgi:hypothetical protein
MGQAHPQHLPASPWHASKPASTTPELVKLAAIMHVVENVARLSIGDTSHPGDASTDINKMVVDTISNKPALNEPTDHVGLIDSEAIIAHAVAENLVVAINESNEKKEEAEAISQLKPRGWKRKTREELEVQSDINTIFVPPLTNLSQDGGYIRQRTAADHFEMDQWEWWRLGLSGRHH